MIEREKKGRPFHAKTLSNDRTAKKEKLGMDGETNRLTRADEKSKKSSFL